MIQSFFQTLGKSFRKFVNVVIIPNIPFATMRVLLYRMVGFKIGKNVFIGMKCYLDDTDPSLTTIGDNVTISYCVSFAIHGANQDKTPITIKEGVYIGMGVLLVSGKKGLTLHENAIIGAGSIVTNSIPPNTIAVGVPAKIIGKV